MKDKIYSMLGLCKKAGRLVCGADVCKQAISQKQAKLLVIAKDASDNTKQKFIGYCDDAKVKYSFFGDIETLSDKIGEKNKAIVAVCDDGFAENIIKLIEEDYNCGGDFCGN